LGTTLRPPNGDPRWGNTSGPPRGIHLRDPLGGQLLGGPHWWPLWRPPSGTDIGGLPLRNTTWRPLVGEPLLKLLSGPLMGHFEGTPLEGHTPGIPPGMSPGGLPGRSSAGTPLWNSWCTHEWPPWGTHLGRLLGNSKWDQNGGGGGTCFRVCPCKYSIRQPGYIHFATLGLSFLYSYYYDSGLSQGKPLIWLYWSPLLTITVNLNDTIMHLL
jgi:hypothetical protein